MLEKQIPYLSSKSKECFGYSDNSSWKNILLMSCHLMVYLYYAQSEKADCFKTKFMVSLCTAISIFVLKKESI